MSSEQQASGPAQQASGPAKRWPDVPACYGWLSLDRRGVWRLQGEPVVHAGLNAFIGQNYRRDESGCWVVHNGPQKVFVSLDYAPWVFRLMPDGTLLTHTGLAAGRPESAYIDEEGAMLFVTPVGPGLLDDRDLARMLADCVTASGDGLDELVLEQAMEGRVVLFWRGVQIDTLRRETVAARFDFVAKPLAPDSALLT